VWLIFCLAQKMGEMDRPPKVYLSGAAIGIYGDRGDESLDETAQPGNSGFLAESRRQWEAAIQVWMHHADSQQMIHAYALNADGKQKHMDIFISLFTLVTAAGGIVSNPSGDILCIYRKGHWDLPKGKVEPGESIQAAALREVEEETHASLLQITGTPVQTLHVYTEKKQRILKSSWWYPMHTQTHQALQPQLEEDIHKAEWVAPESLHTLFPEMYPMIRELLLFNEKSI